MEGFLGSLLESSLLQLHLLGQPTSLDVGEQEGLDQVLDQSFVVVVSPLKSLKVLVHLLLPEVGHDAGLSVGRPLDSVVDDPVEVAVNRPLIHFHHFFVQALLSGPNDLLGVSSTSFLNFPVSPLVFCLLYLGFYFLLFGCSHQFLRKFVQSFSNDLSLQSFIHSISESFLMLFQQNLFGLGLIKIRDLCNDEQFLNKSQSLFFSLVHDVLLSSASQYSLEENDSNLPLD